MISNQKLSPLQEPLIVIESRFVVQHQTTLKLSEERMSISGDDFTIIDANTKQLWFQVDGKPFSFNQKKLLKDNAGVPICTTKEKHFSLTKSQQLFMGKDGPLLCNVKAKFSFNQTKVTANVVNLHNKQPVMICVKGDWMDEDTTISIGDLKQGGVPIAYIHRNLNLKEVFTGKQTYYVTIAPGVDAAFVSMLCVAIDEVCHDRAGAI